MARDNHIIRPDRLHRPSKADPQEMTRAERVKLLVDQILPQVRDGLEARQPKPPTVGKRRP